ncbi:hypothetical protein [Nocardia asiatica]|uniref:hypothetical protein n=1 Tax=Nocardia asiatica TaxID=209252 RepID=UPI0002E5E8CF|nr:hypothetical protein [Nocardia asiatica]
MSAPYRQFVEAAGDEPYVFGREHFPRCPHPWCREEWHGLAITQRMRDMRRRGVLDPDYRYSADDSPVLCPGSLFKGEFTPPPDDVEQLIEYARDLALDVIASIAGLPQIDQFSHRYHLPADFGEPSSMPSFQIGWGGSSSSR